MLPADILKYFRTEREKVWVVGNRARKVTLYSQQVRALNLVYALAKTSRIGRDSEVMIIGGGAAGLTAALAAAYHVGCKVTLLESEPDLMPLQRKSKNRWLHPHIWDWPSEDATSEDAGLPILNWTAASADAVAFEICDRFYKLNQVERRVSVRLNAKNVTLTGQDTVDWTDAESGHNARSGFAAILIAVGFGIEPQLVKIGKLTLPATSYWALDALEQNFSRRKLRYLVSGTGDGGMIEVLRLRLKDFRHQEIISTFLDKDPDGLADQLRGIEQAVLVLPPNEQGKALYEKYAALSCDRLDSLLGGNRLRDDTEVVFHGNGPYWMSSKTSILNRLLVSRLLAGRRDTALTYRHGKFTVERTKDFDYKLTFAGGQKDRFDAIIFRRGPNSDVHGFITGDDLAGLNVLESVDQTHLPLYDDGFFGPTDPSPTRTKRQVSWLHAINKGIQSRDLSWAVVNDAIILPVGEVEEFLKKAVVGPYPFDPKLDALSDQEAYDEETHLARQERWTSGYHPLAAEYLRRNLGEYAKKAGKRMDACKVGIGKIDFTALAKPDEVAFLTLRPINHLVTEVFNRRMAIERIDQSSEAEGIWSKCFSALLADPQILFMQSPSQLFLELSVTTLDGKLVIARKSDTNSIYARRNGGYVRTCGVEGGPNWKQVVKPHESGHPVALDFREYALKLLGAEYKLSFGDAPSGDPKFLHCGSPGIVLHSFAIQGVHLNSAVLGNCRLPLMSSELEKHLRKTGRSGGLVFGEDLQFWDEKRCKRALKEDQGASLWHGTALARVKRLVGNWNSLVDLAA